MQCVHIPTELPHYAHHPLVAGYTSETTLPMLVSSGARSRWRQQWLVSAGGRHLSCNKVFISLIQHQNASAGVRIVGEKKTLLQLITKFTLAILVGYAIILDLGVGLRVMVGRRRRRSLAVCRLAVPRGQPAGSSTRSPGTG